MSEYTVYDVTCYHILDPKLGALSLTWYLAATDERSIIYTVYVINITNV
jgi:hypothetical protein